MTVIRFFLKKIGERGQCPHALRAKASENKHLCRAHKKSFPSSLSDLILLF